MGSWTPCFAKYSISCVWSGKEARINIRTTGKRCDAIPHTKVLDADDVHPFANGDDRDDVDASHSDYCVLDEPVVLPAEHREVLDYEHELQDYPDAATVAVRKGTSLFRISGDGALTSQTTIRELQEGQTRSVYSVYIPWKSAACDGPYVVVQESNLPQWSTCR